MKLVTTIFLDFLLQLIQEKRLVKLIILIITNKFLYISFNITSGCLQAKLSKSHNPSYDSSMYARFNLFLSWMLLMLFNATFIFLCESGHNFFILSICILIS